MARFVRFVITGLLTAAVFAGICVAGVTVSMRQSFPAAPSGDLAGWPAPRPAEPGRLVVAVALGTSGSVVADALLPYEVFARSGRFSVHTVGARREPVPLSGGVHVVPDYTFESGPVPDVIVIPAVVDTSEAALHDWISRHARRGAHVLGVCAGSHVLAATGVLDGRQATEFWANISARRRDFPRVRWVRGQRYVTDGPVTTTAGVTSGALGALHVVSQLAGAAEAARIGRELGYPDGSTTIPVQRLSPADAPYALGAAFPWGRPTLGVGLADGVSESAVAAVFELYSGTSFATRTVALAAGRTVTTRHGMLLAVVPAADLRVDRLILPSGDDPGLQAWAADRDVETTVLAAGEFPFDPVLRDLAAHTDRATARTTAKYTEYPVAQLNLTGPAWSWRPSALAVAALLLSAGVTTMARRAFSALLRSRRAGRRTPRDPRAAASTAGRCPSRQ